MSAPYKVNFDVRDNELDSYGIVHNSNYIIYLEHARHKWLTEFTTINFVDMKKNGKYFVILAIDIQYKKSLVSQDEFYVTVLPEVLTSKVRFTIKQEVRLSKTDELVAIASVTVTCIDENADSPRLRYFVPEEIKNLMTSTN